MIEFIGAFMGACAGTLSSLFFWHWYVTKKLNEEIEKLPVYLKTTILQTEYED